MPVSGLKDGIGNCWGLNRGLGRCFSYSGIYSKKWYEDDLSCCRDLQLLTPLSSAHTVPQ